MCVLGWFSYRPECVCNCVEGEEFIDAGGLPVIKGNRKPHLGDARTVWNR